MAVMDDIAKNEKEPGQENSNSSGNFDEIFVKAQEPKPSQVDEFLSKLGLSQYIAAFDDEGLETMDDLEEINDSQLKEIVGVKKLGHRIKILNGIRAFATAKSYNASSISKSDDHKALYQDQGTTEGVKDRKESLMFHG
eukprot:584866_1